MSLLTKLAKHIPVLRQWLAVRGALALVDERHKRAGHGDRLEASHPRTDPDSDTSGGARRVKLVV